LTVTFLGFTINSKNVNLDKIANQLIYASCVFFRTLFVGRDARVLAVTNPPYLPIILGFASIIRGFRFQLILLDIYPDGLVQVGFIEPRSLTNRIWRKLNIAVFVRAQSIVVLGRDMRELLITGYGVNPTKIEYIPHWAATEGRRYRELSYLKGHDSDPSDNIFIVQYSGNMGLWHDIDSLVRAACMLKHVSDIRFVFIGDGMRKKAAHDLSMALQLTNIEWSNSVPLEELEFSLSQAHVSIISQRSGILGVAVPCKLYGILASGRPIIAAVPEGSEVALVVEEERCGKVVHPHRPDEIAEAIYDLYRHRGTTLVSMGANARAAFERGYHVSIAGERFLRSWRNCFSDCRNP